MLRSPLVSARHLFRPFGSMDNAQQDVHWSTSYHQQSSSTHYPEGEYPSPVPSVSSSYAVPQHQSDSASLSFEQVPSSVGPARVMTRRQRAAFEQKESHGRRSTSVARSPSRAAYQSPAPDSPQTHRQRLSMSMPGPPQMLPPYPLTPDSSTTPYSPSALPYYHHSRSASSHSHPRSASPALSTVTTTSSVSATSNAQTFATFPPPMDVAKPKQRKQRLFNLDRKAICEFHRDNPAARQEDIAAQYGVERSTISKILKHKIKWLSIPDGEDMRIAKHRPSKFPNIESHMMDWLADSETQKTTLSDMRLREKARDVARCLGVGEDRFKASSGWVENFKHRHGIRGGVWTGIGPKSNTKKAKAMGMGTFDTQEMIITVLPQAFDLEVKPEHIGLDGEVIPLEARWQAEQDAAAAAAAAEQHQREHSSDSNHHHQSHTEHSPPLVLDLGQQQHILEHQQHHSPLEHHDQHQLQHHDHHEHEHMSSAQPMDQMEHFPQSVDGLLPTLYHDGRVVYQPISTPSDNPIPSMAEAEEHLNKLLLFFDAPSSEGSGILTPDERDALAQVKMTLFNAASGIRRS